LISQVFYKGCAHLDKTKIFIIVYFSLLAIINFIVYYKLSDYLFISAGVTKEDVKRYTSNQGANVQTRLVKWLRNRTKHPKEFNIILTVCNIVAFLSFVSMAIILTSVINENIIIIKICAAAIPIISAVTTVFGFSYGKKIKLTLGDYFLSGEYIPYEEDSFTDEPYYTEDSSHKRSRPLIFYSIPFIIIVVIILILVLIPKINQLNSNDSDYSNSKMETEYEAERTQPDMLTPYDVNKVMAEAGWNTYFSNDEASLKYPEYEFVDHTCVSVNDEGMQFDFYTLNLSDETKQLYDRLKADINSMDIENSTVQTKNEEDFGLYSIENENVYAVVIYSSNRLIYSNCQPIYAQQLKDNLNLLLGMDKPEEKSDINTNAYGYMFAFAVLSILSRLSFNWLKNISYTFSGQSIIDVEKHHDKIKRKEIPYQRELEWLVSISQKPECTKLFYFLYYILISIAPALLVVSIVDIFVVQLDDFLGKAVMIMIGIVIFSFPIGAFISNIAERSIINKYYK